jgi:hypothetical protein
LGAQVISRLEPEKSGYFPMVLAPAIITGTNAGYTSPLKKTATNLNKIGEV